MLYFQIVTILSFLSLVWGHARLIDPPSRSSMWRFGFNNPVNYNDNELFCGGLTVQHSANKGHCGVCGDPYHMRQPRPNEAGGKYGNGIIVKTYEKGQIINVVVDVTANHLGYFEFKLCPHNNPKTIVSQDCLDKYPLSLANNNSYKFYVKPAQLGKVSVALKLPNDVTCTQCVLQWQYRGENNWGRCTDGRGALGCGPQETFRACADVAITADKILRTTIEGMKYRTSSIPHTTRPVSITSFNTENSSFPVINRTLEIHSTSTISTPVSSTVQSRTKLNTDSSTKFEATSNKITTSNVPFTTMRIPTNSESNNDGLFKQNCEGVPKMRPNIPGLDYWCQTNCAMGHCPPDLCIC